MIWIGLVVWDSFPFTLYKNQGFKSKSKPPIQATNLGLPEFRPSKTQNIKKEENPPLLMDGMGQGGKQKVQKSPPPLCGWVPPSAVGSWTPQRYKRLAKATGTTRPSRTPKVLLDTRSCLPRDAGATSAQRCQVGEGDAGGCWGMPGGHGCQVGEVRYPRKKTKPRGKPGQLTEKSASPFL